jgi:hypothetical protein
MDAFFWVLKSQALLTPIIKLGRDRVIFKYDFGCVWLKEESHTLKGIRKVFCVTTSGLC